MFTKADIRFETIAADTARRRAAIANLSDRRTWFFWIAVVTTICMISTSFIGGSGSAYVFGTVVAWILLFETDSKVRLLRVIDRLNKGVDEKPTDPPNDKTKNG